jgi:hypothetical protein
MKNNIVKWCTLKHLKEIDLYKQNKTFTMSRKLSVDRKVIKHSETIGSKMGGFMTIIVVMSVLLFCTFTYSKMMRGLYDRYNSFNRANHLINGEEEILINGSRFLPSLELIKWKSNPIIDKILTPNGINITELQTYVEPNIVIGIRNKSFVEGFAFDTPGNEIRIIYPMRVCKI